MTSFKLSINGTEREFEAARQGTAIRMTDGEQTAVFHLVYTDGNRFIIEQICPDGSRRRIRVAGHRDGHKRHLWVNGRTFTCERIRERDIGVGNSDLLSASIPAMVSEILVAVGDSVKTDDKLILLESMKMIIPIQAPCDGIVRQINCKVGESVQAGTRLIDIEENGD
jgi:acetyl-CoA carboxylase biotin carboxyl carrier protein